MRHTIGRRGRWFLFLVMAGSVASGPAIAGRIRSMLDLGPIDRQARELLSARRYQDARQAFADLVGKAAGQPQEIEARVLLGKAHLGAGDLAGAIRAWSAVVRRHPTSAWAHKARFLMADAYVKHRRIEEAAAIYRERAAFLHGDRYLAKIAGLYLTLADKGYVGVKRGRAGDPLDPERTVHDWAGALELYRLARQTGVAKARAVEVQHRVAVCLAELGRRTQAAKAWEAFLKEHPDAPQASEATFRWAETLQQTGDLRRARELYRRVESSFADRPEAPRAVYALGRTFRPGRSGDKEALRKGIAHWRRFLQRYPDHELAPKVRFEVADALHKGGELQEARKAYEAVIAADEKAELASRALYQIAEVEKSRGRYDAARATWSRFVARYPTSPRFLEAQRARVDVLFQKAADAFSEKKWESAVQGWGAFLQAYPADRRSPEAALGIGRALLTAGKRDAALAALEVCSKKYQRSQAAPKAELLRATTFAKGGALREAIASYERIVKIWSRSQEAYAARRALARMREHTLQIQSKRAYSTAEPLRLHVETRNVPSLRVKAYALDLEAYFRKKHDVARIEDLAIHVIAPTKAWTDEIPKYEPYRRFERDVELPLTGEGAYLVSCEDDKLRAVTLALRSNIAITTKEGPKSLLVWALDTRTDAPAAGVRVLVSDGRKIVAEGKTGKDGVWEKAFDRAPGAVRVLAVRGKSYAFSKVSPLAAPSWGYETKVYLYTDRPVYRPGQRVRYRGVVREVERGLYRPTDGRKVRVEVVDPRGAVLQRREVTTNAFGSFSGDLFLADEPPLGEYALRCVFENDTYDAGFHVEAYRKPELFVGVTPDRPAAIAGEEVVAKVEATFAFGGPVKEARGRYAVYARPYRFDASRYRGFAWFFQGRRDDEDKEPDAGELIAQGELKTDAQGRAEVRFQTEEGASDRAYTVAVEVEGPSRRWASGGANIFATQRGFFAVCKADRKVYRPNDEVRLTAIAVDAGHGGREVAGEVVVYRRRRVRGEWREDPTERHPLRTQKTGRATLTIRLEKPGQYRVAFEAKDRRGALVAGGVSLMVAGESRDLEREVKLLFEREVYTRGERAGLLINTPKAPVYALLTFEGERVLQHRVVLLTKRSQTLPIDMVDAFAPNVVAEVAMPFEHQLKRASDEVAVLKFLQVEVEPARASALPGGTMPVTIRTRDHQGRPVSAEVSLAVVDEAVFAIRPDTTPAIQPFFYDQRRSHAVRTESSFAWRYRGVTRAQLKELLAERDRLISESRSKRKRESLRREFARLGAKKAMPRPSAAPSGRARGPAAAPPAEAMEGMMDGAGAGLAGKASASLAFSDDEADSPALASPGRTRRRFADTAFWDAHVVTGKDGNATVPVKLPENLTTWRTTVRGATRDTLVGEAKASFRTAQDFLVRLAAPRALTEGDEMALAVVAHNQTDKPAKGRLKLEGGSLRIDGPAETAVTLPPHDAVRREVRAKAVRAGETRLRATLRTPAGADAVEIPLEVRAFGDTVRKAQSGALGDAPVRFTFEVPKAAIPGTAGIELWLTPSIATEILDVLPYLSGYPYGCVEQTVHRFLPAVVAASAMRRAGAEVDRRALDERVRRGVARLVALQRRDGAWGWWGDGPALAETTALALEGLEVARSSGVFVDHRALSRARDAAVRLLGSTRGRPDARALLLRALALSRRAANRELSRALRLVPKMSAQGVANLAVACSRSKRRDLGLRLVAQLGQTAQRDGSGVYWSGAAGRGWFSSALGATARAVEALALFDPEAAELPEAVAWLRAHRHGGRFGSTKDTAAVVQALAGVLSARSAASARGSAIVVTLDGKEYARAVISGAAGQDQKRHLRVGASELPPGIHTIEITRTGRGHGSYAITARAMVRSGPKLEARGSVIRLDRKLTAWVPKTPRMDAKGRPTEPGYTVLVPSARPGWREQEALTEAVSGEKVLGHVGVRVRESVDYVVVEVPLPAGLVPQRDGAQGPFVRYEARDDRVVFFASRLPKGTHVFSYIARAVRPGTYRALPAEAWQMYLPEAAGRSASASLRVTVKTRTRRAPTPDEIYLEALRQIERGEGQRARGAIDRLLAMKLRDPIRDELLVKKLDLQLEAKDGRGAVATFEALLDRNPRLARARSAVPKTGLGLANAYAGLRDFDNALSLARVLVQQRFTSDLKVASVYGRRRLQLGAQDFLLDLVRRYPDSGYVLDQWFRAVKRYYSLDLPPDPKAPKFAPQKRSSKMYLEAYQGLKAFIAFHPESRLCPDAQLTAGRALTRLEQYDVAAVELERLAARYPRSLLADDALYEATRAQYEQGEYTEALRVGQRVLSYRRKLRNGRIERSPFRASVQHLFGKIYHLRGKLSEAVRYYQMVKTRFPDAADALAFLTERKVEVPEVLSAPPGKVALPVRFKNVKRLEAKIYPVDLLVLFAVEKDLRQAARVDLTGITPKAKPQTELGGRPYGWNEKRVSLPIEKRGAYLVVQKADGLDASTLVIASDLEVRVQRTRGRTRAYVTLRSTGAPVRGAYVLVADRGRVLGRGRTDGRGLLEVSGGGSDVSVVAEHKGHYALYRRGVTGR